VRQRTNDDDLVLFVHSRALSVAIIFINICEYHLMCANVKRHYPISNVEVSVLAHLSLLLNET
jgi:hypothetical protein